MKWATASFRVYDILIPIPPYSYVLQQTIELLGRDLIDASGQSNS